MLSNMSLIGFIFDFGLGSSNRTLEGLDIKEGERGKLEKVLHISLIKLYYK